MVQIGEFYIDIIKKKQEQTQERYLLQKHKNKSKYAYKDDRNKVVFGAVMTLHTFGRNLQWNPHIHCLVCEEAYDTMKDKIKNFSFMSYEKLRKTWMYQVLPQNFKICLSTFTPPHNYFL